MTIIIKETGETREITLREWDNAHDRLANGMDVFAECDSTVRDYYNDAGECVMPAQVYADMCEWWDTELAAFDNGEWSWFTENMDDDERKEYTARVGWILYHD